MGYCRPPSTISIPIPSVTWITSRIRHARSIYASPCATLSGSVVPTLPCSSDFSLKLYPLLPHPPGRVLAGVRGCLGGAARCSVRIERAAHPSPAALQHMCVDHGRTDVLVSQEFLHRPNIVIVLQFQALPGAGPVFASRLLVGEQRERYASAAALQQYARIAPVPSAAAKNLGSTGASRARHASDKRL